MSWGALYISSSYVDNRTAMILETMLQRLYASLVHGPCINCRPHGSRQRVDFASFSKFNHLPPTEALKRLLAGSTVDIRASVKPFAPIPDRALYPEEQQKKAAWEDQQKLISKIAGIIEDSVEYEQETGEYALNIGFPLLCLQPSEDSELNFGAKIMAPIAFLPVELTLKRGAVQALSIKPKGEGTDFLIPNPALFAWLEQQTNQDMGELFADPEGKEPLREINEIIAFLLKALELDFDAREVTPEFQLAPAPRAEELGKKPFLSYSAVLGVFPVSNQGLLRDTRAMMEEPNLTGPVVQFLHTDALDVTKIEQLPTQKFSRSRRIFAEENLTTVADPFQARAVKLARECPNLVIHGPPGTGKSQTITNIISDHLAHGERVLFVCDKRTALDVVKNRMDHLGLGHLCAVVHDPQRDQRDLYLGIRNQLEALADNPKHPAVSDELAKMNEELQRLHDDLLECYQALMGAEQGASFHDLVGKWDSIHCETPEQLTSASLQGLNLAEVDHVSSSIKECLSRAEKIEFRNNPWCAAVGLPLPQFLSEPLASFQARLKHLRSLADEADHTVAPSLPKLSSVPLGTQKAEYAELKGLLESLESSSKPEHRKIWAGASLEKLRMAREEIGGLASYQPLLGERLEPELKLIAEAKTIETVNSSLATLKDYQLISPGWLRIFPTAKVKAAKTLLSSYGMQTSAGDIQKLESFLTRFKARLVVSNFYSQQVEETPSKAPVHDDKLKTLFNSHLSVVDFLLAMQQFQNIAAEVKEQIVNSMAQQASLTTSIALCSQLITRCEKLEALENELIASSIFRSDWILKITAFLREGGKLADLTQEFLTRVDTMEDAIRLRDTIGSMPAGLKLAIEATLTASMDVETAWSLIRKQALSNEISNRIKNEPALQAVDVERLDKAFRQYAEKDALKRELARKNILHHWQYKQVQRLLSASGSQLNSIGAKLKQRFFLRGERALKLRQMINHGRDIPDGDPLFDLCPVWMASPATVAQIFPREAIFDVLIFDEASQCKLEEALPALLRGKRVVIAGDPKQLPPTRFFESAVKQSEDDEIESDQDLFERQQRSVEDLLTAALNLDVQQSYLDVHYRSRNEDLIGFSNQNFYDSRLQPIPGHPSNRATEPPIKFYRVEGVYSDRANQAEADTVLTIVKKLLAMPKPPSIGIACFNLPQRDLILETLDNAAAEDTVFSEQLANARARKGEGSFEGLFVKNLENVQGDERDHMIISTTFAPDESGNFRRNFGPVGTIPGGRRLNVLVTRARSAIHLVTSIPRAEYHVLPEKVEGTPSGRWYLYRYLQYAELLKEKYASPLELKTGRKTVRDAALSESVAQKCQSKHGLQGDVEWGNEGFSVDIALHDPTRPGGVTVGVLCDMNRFAKAPDPVEWESFRTTVLERAGWSFHRVWSPAYFRNPEAQLRAIAKAHAKLSTAQV